MSIFCSSYSDRSNSSNLHRRGMGPSLNLLRTPRSCKTFRHPEHVSRTFKMSKIGLTCQKNGVRGHEGRRSYVEGNDFHASKETHTHKVVCGLRLFFFRTSYLKLLKKRSNFS